MMEPLTLLRELYAAALQAAMPDVAIATSLPDPPRGRTVVIGAGKAAASMALAFDAAWPRDRPLSGVVVTRYGYVPPGANLSECRIRIRTAAHPVPDDNSLIAGQCIRDALRGLTGDDLVVALVSGGGSSLLAAPIEGDSLEDERRLNEQLLRCGASIGEMNVVRRHLSSIKGGRMAAWCRPARLLTLVMSDVPGDRVEDIASGPTVCDPSTCEQALEIVRRHRIDLPAATIARLSSTELETPKPGDPAFAEDEVILVATPSRSLGAAAAKAESLGIRAYILGDALEGEARDSAIVHAGVAKAIRKGGAFASPPCVLLSAGEATVTLPREQTFEGLGGRCSEFALAAANYLQGEPGVWVLCAGTDGVDGSGDAAGAVVTPSTLSWARDAGLDAAAFLAAHDSGSFFRRLDAQVVTGPTFTNVNDFRAVLVLAD